MTTKKRIVYLYLTLITAILELTGGLFLAELFDGFFSVLIHIITWIIFFGLLVLVVYLEYAGGPYLCKHCGHEFMPRFAAFMCSMHMGTTRLLKCPVCGKRIWCEKIWK